MTNSHSPHVFIASQATSAALYGIFGAKAKHPFLSEDSLKQMKDFHRFSGGWGAGMEYGLGCMNSSHFQAIVDNKTDLSYGHFYGHAGADFGSLAPMHEYNPKLDIAITVATTAVQGMNCSMSTGNNKDLFSIGCAVWRTITDIATDGKARIECRPAPWERNAIATPSLQPTHHLHLHHDPNPSSPFSDPDTHTRKQSQVGAKPPTHCAVKDAHQCVGQSRSLNGTDCFRWRSFHSGFNGPNWFRCRTLWADPCACAGVTCSADGTRILEIILRDNNLEGLMATRLLAGMTSLTALDLSHNRIFGSLGTALSVMPNLKTLFLNNNLLSGVAPELNYSTYSAGCSIANNSFDCPMPQAAASCHREGGKSPTCQRMPLSGECHNGKGRLYANASIMSAYQQLQQVGSRAPVGALAGLPLPLCFASLPSLRTRKCTCSLLTSYRNLNVSLRLFLTAHTLHTAASESSNEQARGRGMRAPARALQRVQCHFQLDEMGHTGNRQHPP